MVGQHLFWILSFSFTIPSIWQNRAIVALTSLQVPTEAPTGICTGASFRLSSLESSIFLATHQTFSNRSPKAGSFCCQGSVTIVCLLPSLIFLLASLLSGLGLVIIRHSDNLILLPTPPSPGFRGMIWWNDGNMCISRLPCSIKKDHAMFLSPTLFPLPRYSCSANPVTSYVLSPGTHVC